MIKIEPWILMSLKRVSVNMAFILNQRYLWHYFFASAWLQNEVSIFAMILNMYAAPCSHQAGAMKLTYKNRELKQWWQQKCSRVRLAKQQLCSCIMFFLYISLPSLHVYDVKLPNFMFCRGWEHKTILITTIFVYFFCEVRCSPFKFNSWENRQPVTN